MYIRGRPNNYDPVHYWTTVRTAYGSKDDAICRTGNYHIKYTTNPKEVTCSRCISLMSYREFDK